MDMTKVYLHWLRDIEHAATVIYNDARDVGFDADRCVKDRIATMADLIRGRAGWALADLQREDKRPTGAA